jgi:hypothetical protein
LMRAGASAKRTRELEAKAQPAWVRPPGALLHVVGTPVRE